MKKLIPLLLCLLLLCGCAKTYDGPTVGMTVLSVREEKMYGRGDGTVTQHWTTEHAYDIYGNCTVMLEYQDAEPFLKTVMTYDESGNLIRQVQYRLNGLLPKKIVDSRYTYDDLGRLCSTRHHAGGLSWDDDTTVYDDAAMTRTITTGDGTIAVDHMNALGWVMRTEQTFSDGRFVETEYERDAAGNPVTIREYENGTVISEIIYTYDDLGRTLTNSKTENGSTTLQFSWEYRENTEIFTDHINGYRNITRFHPDGRKDTVETYDASGKLTRLTTFHCITIQVPAGEEDAP